MKPRHLPLLTLMVAASLVGCTDKKVAPTPQTTTDTTTVAPADSAASETHVFTTKGVTIHKQWVSDNPDGTIHLFDLTSPDIYIESLTLPEAMARKKHKYGLEANTFYIIKDAPKYKVLLFKDYAEDSGEVRYLVFDGAESSRYQYRFTYSHLTADSVTISYMDGTSYVYKALDKHVESKILPKYE